MDDAQLTEVLGVPWDELEPRHQDMARELLNDPGAPHWDKAVQFAVHLMAFQGGYDGALARKLKRRANVLLRALAEAGDAESQRELGRALMHGEGITKNAGEAVVWLIRALEQGDARAAYDLGCVYEHHRGAVRRDLDRSTEYFRLAEEMGYDPSRG